MKKYGQKLIYPLQEQPRYEATIKARLLLSMFKLVASNEPLLGCGPLPDWLRTKRRIYAVDTKKDNLCVWRCLAIYKRLARGETNQVQKKLP